MKVTKTVAPITAAAAICTAFKSDSIIAKNATTTATAGSSFVSITSPFLFSAFHWFPYEVSAVHSNGIVSTVSKRAKLKKSVCMLPVVCTEINQEMTSRHL